MSDLPAFLGSTADLALVVLGFGLLIVIHELGHFLAARWAGIRVLAFAVGMGPALASWRKGMGWRRGSSEREYLARVNDVAPGPRGAVSPTEYRLNLLPFGGYVKMLGQDDVNPNAVSAAPDSYQSCPVWKRMVVISAGVVANMITAACLFVLVFRVGLPTEPAVIGDVAPGSAASAAVASNAAALGITEPGLLPGDRILDLDGARPESFSDLTLATAMAGRDDVIRLVVERPGVPESLHFAIKPKVGVPSGLLEMGVEPPRSARIVTRKTERQREELTAQLTRAGLPGVKPGMMLVRVGANRDVKGAEDVDRAVRESGGKPVELEFADEQGRATVAIRPRAEFQRAAVTRADKSIALQPHAAGLTPVLGVFDAGDAREQGLADGDVFVRVGTVEYPSISSGTAEIRAHAGRKLDVVVSRTNASGGVIEVPLRVSVSREGTIGFLPTPGGEKSTLLALPVATNSGALPAAAAVRVPGTRVVSVNGAPVTNFTDIRERLREAAVAALAKGETEVRATLVLRPPAVQGAARPDETATIRLSRADMEAIKGLSWISPIDPAAFELEQTVLKASTSADAVRMGVRETHRVMMSVYTTFARLFERTVKIEHLKGPVGIAALGTRVADRGIIWLLFFMGLISANLAVINFLPLPIVDGGQFLFLVAEAVRGKPVPLGIQNAATIVGLVLIGSMFLVVTFNDIVGIIGK